jgi:hypothetical protein
VSEASERSLSFLLFIAMKVFSAASRPPSPPLPLPAAATSDGTAPRIYAAHVHVRLWNTVRQAGHRLG